MSGRRPPNCRMGSTAGRRLGGVTGLDGPGGVGGCPGGVAGGSSAAAPLAYMLPHMAMGALDRLTRGT